MSRSAGARRPQRSKRSAEHAQEQPGLSSGFALLGELAEQRDGPVYRGLVDERKKLHRLLGRLGVQEHGRVRAAADDYAGWTVGQHHPLSGGEAGVSVLRQRRNELRQSRQELRFGPTNIAMHSSDRYADEQDLQWRQRLVGRGVCASGMLG